MAEGEARSVGAGFVVCGIAGSGRGPHFRAMRRNRSIPETTVMPVLSYPDLAAAVQWLDEAFGFVERVRIGDHRVQMLVGDGAMVARQGEASMAKPDGTHSVLVRVDDVDAHHARAMRLGAVVIREPATHPFGERQYSVVDLAGHEWTFTQTVDDVAPETWGGVTVDRGS